MNLKTIVGGAIVAVGVMAGGSAFAAGAGTSCADFAKLDATAQAKIINDMGPTPSLTTTTTSSNKSTATATAATANASAPTKSAALPTLSADLAVSACQASPNSSVQDAISKAGYTPGTGTTTTTK